ncbi:endoplasmic reticulum junction formation protein lunapark isoform X2 [Ornithorhynchus anatinus]|uniref:Endoplasmic reticulum junction formation protein lunapark n=1 Tax=Ornithorhynchus anatinus TaxID=9258 RepID=A0A6I8P7D7_ORNAN|nr:endoplasmic reticulum junction formation protein lunapark isoform X2 [Ornithorhynchus anatinus]
MGGLFSRWRAKPSTVEVLENIDKEIQSLEEFREKNQRLQKLWVGRLLLYSSVLYLLTCIIVYLWYLPDEFTARLTMTLPFFTFPLIIWTIRTVLIFFFSKRTERNNEALEDLKSQKKKILEEVMEKETYKTAKLILERFDPDSKKAKELELPSAGAAATTRPGQGVHPPGPPLARPILPRERGALDRVVEYLVGDGPQNRYALICQQCFSHNGMALKEEFEYIAFRCAYCFFLNPARKTRPQAPRLPDFSFEKKSSIEGPSSIGSLQLEDLTPSGAPLSDDSLEEQDSPVSDPDPTDERASGTEQTNLDEEVAGSKEQEEKIAEEAENEETTQVEAKSTATNVDSAAAAAAAASELSGETFRATD